jgi:subtilisin family serine protease
LLLLTAVTAVAKEDPDLGPVDVLVYTGKPYAGVVGKIEAWGGTVRFEFENVDALAATLDRKWLDELSALKAVDMVRKDRTIDLPQDKDGIGVDIVEVDAESFISGNQLETPPDYLPDTYISYMSDRTGAIDTWGETGAGAGATVAVIDTGTYDGHPCLAGRVAAGPDLSFDVGTPFEGSTAVTNHYHGTFVAGVAAANCALLLPHGDALREAVLEHSPASLIPDVLPGWDLLPLTGIAPAADVYAIKVFDHTGGGIPTSIVLAGIDHAITAKLTGAVDIDVINMSIGGASLFDGRDLEDKLVDAATEAGIVVVAAASNDGPAPNTGESPGVARTSISVGAISDTPHTRIRWEYFYGRDAAYEMYPDAFGDLRMVDFSSRGPTGDGRYFPDLVAVGYSNFSLFPATGLGWGQGTSFSAPEVAGVAALMQAWNEMNGDGLTSMEIRNAIIDGAVSIGSEWDRNAQGSGYVNAPETLALIMSGKTNNGLRLQHDGELKPNIRFDKNGVWEGGFTDLAPARTVDYIFEVTEDTEKITIEVFNTVIPPNSVPVPGFAANSFEFYVKAQRSGAGYIFDSANADDDFAVEIGDGYATVLSGPVGGPVPPANMPIQPGLYKVTLETDWTSSAAMSADVRITVEEDKTGPVKPDFKGTLKDGEAHFWTYDVPAGLSSITFDLEWRSDWSKFPTNDLDLFAISPGGVVYFSGASLNSPERQVVLSPEAGEWLLIVDGYEVWTGCSQGTSPTSNECANSGQDRYNLYVTTE